jgi:hypothetical protein
MPKGSVKIMLSYDYCHFEIALASDEEMTLKQIDEMRKDAQRLADKAVKQYQTAKSDISRRYYLKGEAGRLELKVNAIKENYPKSEWTPDQKSAVKTFEDIQFRLSKQYDYDDDWDYDDECEDCN